MTDAHLTVVFVTAAANRCDEALSFCSRFGFDYRPFDHLPVLNDSPVYVLSFSSDRIEILSRTSRGSGPVYVDFESARNNYRRKSGGGRGELLAKAIGLRKGVSGLNVVDATAGLAQDALVLANLGCRLTLFERNPIIHCLLQDGIRRARSSSDTELAALVRRFDLHYGPADFSGNADVAYLDPMFPKRNAKTRAGKEMSVFQDIVGEDDDGCLLLNLALQSKVKRVVVKRPRLAENLADIDPSHRIVGRSSRFDVYARQKLKS